MLKDLDKIPAERYVGGNVSMFKCELSFPMGTFEPFSLARERAKL